MPYIRFFKNISKADVAIAGGKGASLGEMAQAGFPVPSGFVVVASAFDRFTETGNLKQEIASRLAEVKVEDVNSVDKASNVLRDVIHDVPMPTELAEEILSAHQELFAPTPSPRCTAGDSPSAFVKTLADRSGRGRQDSAFVAVRSSATAEDSQVASWAGELETYLNVTRNELIEKVKQCWSSLFTPRAIFYRHEKNLIDAQVSVAVVVQKMIQSEVAGVAFTVHPVIEDRDQMIIEACFGLGEALVSGQVTPDSYVISKSDLSIIDIQVGEQRKKLIKTLKHENTENKKTQKTLENEWVELSEQEGGRQKLSGRQIIELAQICKKIEAHYEFPCDIEWAFADGQFYITQSRPITTLKLNK